MSKYSKIKRNKQDSGLTILHIITGLNNGGAEASLWRLVTSDIRNNHLVVSLTGPGWYKERLQRECIYVTNLDIVSLVSLVKGLFSTWGLARERRVDLIQSWMYHSDLFSFFLSVLTRIPCVWSLRTSNPSSFVISKGTILVTKACSILSYFPNIWIASCSQAGIKGHVSSGYCSKRMRYIPNGFSLSDAKFNATDQLPINIHKGVPTLGMLARFDKAKDHEALLSSLKMLSDRNQEYHCFLGGDGITPENRRLAEIISELGLTYRITLLGSVTNVVAFYTSIDIHILSSLLEGFPNVIAESMLCGTPCVATDVGDSRLIIGDTGWVVPAGMPEQLANAISHALMVRTVSKREWIDRQELCRERIRTEYSVERLTDRYNNLWVTALSSSRR